LTANIAGQVQGKKAQTEFTGLGFFFCVFHFEFQRSTF
jgi:hypothetical protein